MGRAACPGTPRSGRGAGTSRSGPCAPAPAGRCSYRGQGALVTGSTGHARCVIHNGVAARVRAVTAHKGKPGRATQTQGRQLSTLGAQRRRKKEDLDFRAYKPR